MSDKRRSQRQRVLKGGKILFGGSVIDCTIRNLSSEGAALDVASPVGIPEEFRLQVGEDNFRCAVVWRKEKRIGIRILL